MVTKVIKTEKEYLKALEVAEHLIELDPEPGSTSANELELLTLLIQVYENEKTSLGSPSPIEAIKFRMEQQDLKQKDLIPFIGSKSKVSEVLSGERKLSLQMIRAISKGLGIPEKVLLQDYNTKSLSIKPTFEIGDFPIKDLVKVGWLSSNVQQELLLSEWKELIAPLGFERAQNVLFRMTRTVRTDRLTDPYALISWTAKVIKEAGESKVTFDHNSLTQEFMKELVKLSVYEDGPVRAQERLSDIGIRLVTVRALPHMYIDGAAILNTDPIVGLTLRYDRLDNFWFTLMHELSHVFLHYGKNKEFFDDLEFRTSGEPEEVEADHLAGNTLIPNDAWAKSAASRLPTAEAAKSLAAKLNINIAIVAGRIRREFEDYKLLTQFIGKGLVRSQFGISY